MNDYKPMSAQFLKKRGYCCKSACLHCPYGFTLKRHGLQFKDATEDLELAQKLAGRSIAPEEAPLFKLILLKNRVAGAMRVNHIQVKELFLREEFQEQGLDLEIVESYFFY